MKYWLAQFSTGYTEDGSPAITSAQDSLIVSILSAGTFFGALFAGPAADFFGRRIGLLLSTVVFCFGVILQTASTAIPMFAAGRFFAGMGVGLISAMSTLPSDMVRSLGIQTLTEW
jgi:SP family sugar:H+ symporter-like MFS transporter